MHKRFLGKILVSWGACSLPAWMLSAQVPVQWESLRGETQSATLIAITSAGELHTSEGGTSGKLSDVLSLVVPTAQVSTVTRPATVHLTSGGRVFADECVFTGETVNLQNSLIGSRIPLEAWRGTVWQDHPLVRETLARPLTDKDQLVVDNDGEWVVISGIIESLDAEKIQINFEGRSRSVARSKVAAVVLAELTKPAVVDLQVVLQATDGSVLIGELETWENQEVTLKIGGKPLRITESFVSRLDVRSQRWTYVSELEPIAAEVSPVFAPPREWRRDLSVLGNPLRLMVNGQPQTFRRGLGVATYSRLVFDNSGSYQELTGWVGIDAETSGRGACDIEIRGDGVPLFQTAVRGDQPAVRLQVSIAGYQKIELIAQPGPQFDLADHVDWADLKWIR